MFIVGRIYHSEPFREFQSRFRNRKKSYQFNPCQKLKPRLLLTLLNNFIILKNFSQIQANKSLDHISITMSQAVCNSSSLVSKISAFSGGASFTSNLVASIPQLIETYQQKSVEGLSLILVSVWVIGDITSFIGCFLTDQMFFQYVLALYFLFNDCILVGQYYYYGYYLKKHPHFNHHHRHSHGHSHSHAGHSHIEPQDGIEYGSTGDDYRKKSSGSLSGSIARAAIPAAVVASNIGQSDAFPIGNFSTEFGGYSIDSRTWGIFFAWFGAALYFFSRIPQLLKNYERKSTEDVSPILFACMLFGNATYTISILVSCDFIYGEDRWGFFINELPYIIGSAGTIVFDILYFYQVWLYKDQSPIKDTETQPLLNSD